MTPQEREARNARLEARAKACADTARDLVNDYEGEAGAVAEAEGWDEAASDIRSLLAEARELSEALGTSGLLQHNGCVQGCLFHLHPGNVHAAYCVAIRRALAGEVSR